MSDTPTASRPRVDDRTLRNLTDAQLVECIIAGGPVDASVTDEYYRRVIPLFRRMLGIHWHTGFHPSDATRVGPEDQVRMIQVVVDSINLVPENHILDVGCGIGGTAIWLARHRGNTVVGLTPVEEQGRIAEALIAEHGVEDRARIVLGYADRLPFADESFDVVLFFESACHFPDRASFFSEAFRVLRPGGRLAGEDWLAQVGLTSEQHQRLIEPIQRTWSIRALGTGEDYCRQMLEAGFTITPWIDLRSESRLSRAFSVEPLQQLALIRELSACTQPLERLLIKGILRLGQAVAENAFTIGRFAAIKPERQHRALA